MKVKFEFKKYVVYLVIALSVAFIWSNSFDTGSVSSMKSGFFKELILKIADFFGSDISDSFFVENFRKFAHFAEYFILGAELQLLNVLFYKKRLQGFVNIVFAGTLVALIDESIQLLSVDRSAAIMDVWIDLGGFTIGIVVIAFLSEIILHSNTKRGRRN